MAKWGIKISKENINVFTAIPKELEVTTEYDMFRIAKTGTLTVSLPAETHGAGPYSTSYTATYTHGLGYTPLFMPDVDGTLTYTIFDNALSIVVNDAANYVVVTSGGPPSTNEKATLYVTSTQLVLQVDRTWDYEGTFAAHDVLCRYTIFHNKMSDTFNLL